jgi:hypothetical protein
MGNKIMKPKPSFKRGELTELKELVKAASDKKFPKANYRKFNFGRKS